MRLTKICLSLALVFLSLFFVPFVNAAWENTSNGFSVAPLNLLTVNGITKIEDYLYLTDNPHSYISKLDLSGNNQTGIPGPNFETQYGIWGNTTDMYIIANGNKFLSHIKGGVNQTDGCSLSSFTSSPVGLWGNDSGLFWISDNSLDKLFLIDSSCNNLNEINTAPIGAENVWGILGDNSKFLLLDAIDNSIYCMDLFGNNQSECFIDPKLFGAGQISSLTGDDSNIWISDYGDDFIYKIHYVPNPSIVYWDNESLLNVNSSNYWNNLGSFNSSQMVNYDGVLNILVSWLDTEITSIFNSLFRNYFNQNLNKTDTPTFTGVNITGDYIYNGNNRYSFSELNATGSEGTSFDYYNLTNSDIIASNNEGVIILTLPLTSGKNISIECNLLVDSESITTGIQLNSTLFGTSSRRQLIEHYDPINSPNVCSSSSESLICAPLISAGETTTSSKINIYSVQSNAGVYELKLMSSVSGSNVYVRAGSWCRSIEF